MESVEISINRVNNRVLRGGHGIEIEKLVSRYDKSFRNLREILSLCDEFIIFDNSEDYAKDVIALKNNKIIVSENNIPEYLRSFIQDYLKIKKK